MHSMISRYLQTELPLVWYQASPWWPHSSGHPGGPSAGQGSAAWQPFHLQAKLTCTISYVWWTICWHNCITDKCIQYTVPDKILSPVFDNIPVYHVAVNVERQYYHNLHFTGSWLVVIPIQYALIIEETSILQMVLSKALFFLFLWGLG